MQQDNIVSFIKYRMQEIFKLGDQVSADFKLEDIEKFKKEVRFVRSWMEFTRLNTGDVSMRLGEKCKKIYNIAGVMLEALAGMNTQQSHATELKKWNDLLESGKKEWKRNYNQAIFVKLEKQLLEFNYSKIPPELMDNFLNNRKNNDIHDGLIA